MEKNITFSSHYVTYKVFTKNRAVLSESNSACFGSLFRLDFDTDFKLILSDFLRVQTFKYAEEYIKIISKICDVEVTFISDNAISVIGFKNKFVLKMFVTLYRILFESNSGMGCVIGRVIEKRIEFFEALINKVTLCKYRCNLKRLIHFHNLYIKDSLGNSNHCIRPTGIPALKIRSKTELLNHKINDSVHLFFI